MRGLVIALTTPLLFASCGLSTLHTAEMQESVSSATRGREILADALDAAGGLEAWDVRSVAEMEFTDEWRGLIGRLYRPWPANPTHLRMRFEFGMRSAECEFLSEELRGLRWGRDEQGTWTGREEGAREYSDHERARFILAAYQYFFELPRRILDAPIVEYAGQRERDGRTFDLVFATWGTAEPHKEHDQYLLWVSRDTHRIEIAQYTIRDKLRSATGVNFFSDFREVDGLTIPHAYRITQHLDGSGFVHRVRIENVRFVSGQSR